MRNELLTSLLASPLTSLASMVAGGKPPTTNLLLSDERTRLIRSARKLGAVMGTTPLLVDPDGPAPQLHIVPPGGREGTSMEIILPVLREGSSEDSHRSSKREGVVFTVSSRLSRSSLDSAENAGRAPLPSVAKLFLCQDARNSLNSVTRLRLVLTLTQPSGPYLSNHHRSTDSFEILTRSLSVLISAPPPSAPDHAARRRKMVKLVNMLGGPIPPSLVFPRPPDGRPRPPIRTDRASRRRSRSVPPPAIISAAPPPPRKLVRPPPAPDEVILPALNVDKISRPRPLAAYTLAQSASKSPSSFGTASSGGSRGRGRRPRSVTPSYSLRRHTRDSKYASES
ncbi:hypothetical protein B0H17DRAFT_1296071 [Mycena rosella]|uniref:Uncharacterized protein n=1 Tax=Mycena rosella TaxID=1033263 RepID=A0AAD7GIC9_MYCRO|nr:hypothetical protein B0H17DRAFT_1296071 [Mycena rosella]